ncbi:MAG: hypothetical protein ACPLVJ_00150 [Candidatus Bathyarchaeales archaeon]
MSLSRETNNDNICSDRKKSQLKIRLNMILRAETAKMLAELRSRGLISSYSEGIRRSVQLFYERILEQDLRSARLKILRREFEEK